jgi:superfamily II DNA helicase RecQ
MGAPAAPDLTALSIVSENRTSVINSMLKEVWGVDSPHSWQTEAVHELAFGDEVCLLLVRKTGDGKTNVLLGAATLLGGVSLCVVPLLGLGVDQEARVESSTGELVRSFHLDELRGEAKCKVVELLSDFPKRARVVLFASPQSLEPGKGWRSVVSSLIDQRALKLVAIDEVCGYPRAELASAGGWRRLVFCAKSSTVL